MSGVGGDCVALTPLETGRVDPTERRHTVTQGDERASLVPARAPR